MNDAFNGRRSAVGGKKSVDGGGGGVGGRRRERRELNCHERRDGPTRRRRTIDQLFLDDLPRRLHLLRRGVVLNRS